jgi:hypothetical protein
MVIEEVEDTLGNMKDTFDGLTEALLMGEQDEDEDVTAAEHWAVSDFFYRSPDADEASAAKCIGELQELMMEGHLTDDTEVWTHGMDDWLPIVQLLEEQEELAASMMSEFPTSLAWLDDEATEHPISIVDFRAALREQIADDETQVFAEGFMEGFAPLAECRALLGISAAMGANEGEDDDEEGDEKTAGHLDEAAVRAVSAAMAKNGIGQWRRAKRAAAFAMLRTKSRNMFDVIRKADQSGAIEIGNLSKLEMHKKRDDHKRSHSHSQRAKVTIHVEEISLDGLVDVHATSVAAECGRESAKTPSHVVTDGHVGWLGFSFDFHVKEVNDDSQVMFHIDQPTERSQLALDLSLFIDGHTRQLTLPFSGGAPGEMTLTVTLLGVKEAQKKKKKKEEKEKKHAKKAGGIAEGTPPPAGGAAAALLGGEAGGGGNAKARMMFKSRVRLVQASREMVNLSANAQAFAASEVATTVAGGGSDGSPMGKLLAAKMQSGELKLNPKTGEAKIVAAEVPSPRAQSGSFEEVIGKVRQPLAKVGGLNWMLCEADPVNLTVVDSGIGSIPEMQQALDPEKVLYGLVRLGFGKGKFRRTKWCFVHWTGEAVGAVARGRLNNMKPEMAKLLTPHHVSRDASSTADMDVGAVVSWIVSVIVSDDLDTDVYSVEGFMDALKEEKKMAGVTSAEDDSRSDEEDADEAEASGGGDEDDEDDDDDDGEFENSDDELDEPVRVRTQDLPTEVPDDGSNAALIVDLGYGECKFGMAGDASPSRLPCRSEERRDLITREQLSMMDVKWDDMEALWNRIFQVELDLPASECIVACTVSPYGPDSYSETLAEMLFEETEIPSLFFGLSGIQNLYAVGKTSGLVFDSGTCITSVIPVVEGYCVKSAVKSLPFGGRDITERIALEAGVSIDNSFRSMAAVQRLKEALCSINEPPCSSASASASAGEGQEIFTLPDGSAIEVTPELRTQCRTLPEHYFFAPSQLTFDVPYEEGVDKMVLSSLAACSIDTRQQLLENLVLAGGNTYIHGFTKALLAQLKEKGKKKVAHLKKLNANKHRDTNAWLGGCVLASLSGWHDELISATDYDETGPEIVHKCVDWSRSILYYRAVLPLPLPLPLHASAGLHRIALLYSSH